jgi:hypothetical protein
MMFNEDEVYKIVERLALMPHEFIEAPCPCRIGKLIIRGQRINEYEGKSQSTLACSCGYFFDHQCDHPMRSCEIRVKACWTTRCPRWERANGEFRGCCRWKRPEWRQWWREWLFLNVPQH